MVAYRDPKLYYDQAKCMETVYVKDVPRYTGRVPGGFEMHYNKQQCSRRHQDGREYCWQHPYNNPGGKP